MATVELPGLAPADASSWRTLEYFALARVLVASALVLTVATFGAPFGAAGRAAAGLASAAEPPHLLAAVLAYFALAAGLAVAAFYVRQSFTLQVAGQLAIDMIAITSLVVVGGGMRSGMVILYLLPLAGASLLLPTAVVFSVCSLAVIALLADAFVRALQPGVSESLVFQSGLFGAALFAVTGLLRMLASRLAEQERLAVQRGRNLENQLEINRLVIGQMEQGVVVVDADTKVRANNRAARVLLGLAPGAQLTGQRLGDLPALRPLTDAFLAWRERERPGGTWSHSVMQSLVRPGAAQAMPELQLRARFAQPASDDSDEFVIFLEDVRAVEQRAQQLKLAAMGRLTASIAHEIRNPLAAISHAGQLMAEDAHDPTQRRLAGIVRENTQRLNRLVEDVLRVARREPPLGDEIDLGPFIRHWLDEFHRDRSLAPDVVRLEAGADLRVKFEQSHLRQVLFNLIDNALRYATGKAGSVRVVAERALDEGGRISLWVFDDGPGVAADARAALFEPFFTTHTRGTGLGLYIAREFCVANRSDLSYGARREMDGTSSEGFLLRFARTTGTSSGELGFLDTMPVQ